MNAWIPIALLPISPKHLDKIPGNLVKAQELDAFQVTHEILSSILSPLADAGCQEEIEMVCCDEKVRKCVPRLSAWLANHMENVMIHGILTNRCPVCIAPPNKFGDLPDMPHNPRQYSRYATAYRKSNQAVLQTDGVKQINNALWHVLNLEPHTLVRGDTLYTLYLGMLKHLMKWIQEFLDHVGCLTVFDYIWSRLPLFPGFTRPNKGY
ncbi:hypothetical protein BGX38DRAFT_1147505 [Terfezia claveryi]|nr:hypothetical protein BGX38DRAFT_1147505 [Terfezia claveryi]